MEPTVVPFEKPEDKRISITPAQSSYLKQKSMEINNLRQQASMLEAVAKAHEEGIQQLMIALKTDNAKWTIENIGGEDFLVSNG